MTTHRSIPNRLALVGLLPALLVLGVAHRSMAQLVAPPVPGTFMQAPFLGPPPEPLPLSSVQVVERVAPSVVVILAGSNSVPVTLGSGVIVRSDGIVMTAYHTIKERPAVQVRLKNGETYDRVVVLGFDERRDVAALRIPANNLQTLDRAPVRDVRPGTAVYTISNPAGLEWTASSGILSAIRMADDVPGGGTGYRLLQVTAPVTHGSSGGTLVDDQGRLLGIVVGSLGGQGLNFAVPLESVLGLANRVDGLALSSGRNLGLHRRSPGSSVAERTEAPRDPAEVMHSAHTICLIGNPEFPAEPLEKKLFERSEFKEGRLVLVEDPHVADLIIELSRKPLTWDFTYRLVHPSSGVILGSGKVIAWDGVRAAPEIANQIMDRVRALQKAAEKAPEPGTGKNADKNAS